MTDSTSGLLAGPEDLRIENDRRRLLVWAMTGSIDSPVPPDLFEPLPERMLRRGERDPRNRHVAMLAAEMESNASATGYLWWRCRYLMALLLMCRWPSVNEVLLAHLLLPPSVSRAQIKAYFAAEGVADIFALSGHQRGQLLMLLIELARYGIVGSLFDDEREVLGLPRLLPIDDPSEPGEGLEGA